MTMLPTGSDPRALRAKLLEYLGNVKQFFEATNVGFNLNASPYWSAFDALRRNKPLAEEFVTQLTTLLDFLDRELAPALLQAQNQAPGMASPSAHAPAGPWPGQPGALPSPLPGSALGSIPGLSGDETQILDRASPSHLIQRIAHSDPVPRAPAPTPGMTNRRPEPVAAPEPVRVATPLRPTTPPRGMPPVTTAPPPPSHDERPMGDVAGELSLADVLIADRDLLADPSGPPIPQPIRRPSEAHLPGVAREIRKSIPPAPAVKSVQAEEPAPAAKRAALLAAALEAPEPAKAPSSTGRPGGAATRAVKTTTATAPAPVAPAPAPTAAVAPVPTVDAPKGIKLPPIAKPSKTAATAVVASTPEVAAAAAPTVVGGSALSADAVKPAAAAVKPAAKEVKTTLAKPVSVEKATAPEVAVVAEKPMLTSMPPIVEKAALADKPAPAGKPAIALPGVGRSAGAVGKPAPATKVAQEAESKPSLAVQAKPVEAKAAELRPVAVKAVEAKPIEAKPVAAKAIEAKPVEAKPVAAKPIEAKPIEAKPAPVAAKPVAAVATPAVVAPAASKPVPAAKPVAAVKVTAAKAAAAKAVAEKAPVFDQSDMSDPSMSPSQFFRVLDAKLPFDDDK